MARNAASLALRLRSPRDRPLLPCSIDVLLVCWDTKPVITPGGRLGLNRYEVLLGGGTGAAAAGGADENEACRSHHGDASADTGRDGGGAGDPGAGHHLGVAGVLRDAV